MSAANPLSNKVDPDKAVRDFLAWYGRHANGKIVIDYDEATSEDGTKFDLSEILLTLQQLVA